MNEPDYTTVLACDLNVLSEFRLAMPTWRKNRPDVWRHPMIVFCDARESVPWWGRQLSAFCDHPDIRIVPWPVPRGADQRHAMLSSFVYGTAEYCRTPWWLKIDSDACCAKNDPRWMPAEWTDEQKRYDWIASPWGYTKHGHVWTDLLKWAERVPEFAGKEEVPGKYRGPMAKVKHHRCISFVMLGRTEFMQMIAGFHKGPLLPIPSQDTYLWYCSARLGRTYFLTKFGEYAWQHSKRRLERYCREAMQDRR